MSWKLLNNPDEMYIWAHLGLSLYSELIAKIMCIPVNQYAY